VSAPGVIYYRQNPDGLVSPSGWLTLSGVSYSVTP
jgi:hypothetical protein